MVDALVEGFKSMCGLLVIVGAFGTRLSEIRFVRSVFRAFLFPYNMKNRSDQTFGRYTSQICFWAPEVYLRPVGTPPERLKIASFQT